MSTVIDAPKTDIKPTDSNSGSLGGAWKVIVLNDNHNTFEGVAGALSTYIPGVDYNKGMRYADQIHKTGRAVVWVGQREPAELYWEQLSEFGLTMAALEKD